ncbi:hypothetical protein GCM10008904_07260 [Paraclostridium ghonii]|uniref:Uncharacterized protein n=1 Tax=Paraclostridium ghonii TaxID=29358 RepID=A0ABU0N2R9_9FIRM|nr:hypothetical protein [Paeniclostridium ghonii]MDQ0557461.1 hypothetical protein [Paeniclostridium ghonii]
MIPFKDEEEECFIEIKNPTEDIIKNIKEKIISRINRNEDFDNNDIIEYLIKELTNIKLTMSLQALLTQDISYECKMMLYYITEIYNEIQTEILCMVKMELMTQKLKKLKEEVALDMQQV